MGETWAQQLKDAMNVNGGDVENASTGDYIMHFLTFGFKIIFALIPPAGIGGGWPCFFVSLGMIGLLTAIVGDLAGIFGCLVGLKDSVTAITFVALGTSLPDTFASKAAATSERTADNAIGNITGSNSVNVFLGLGLPWCIASIYWILVPVDSPEAEAWRVQYRNVPEAMAWLEKHNQLIFVVNAGSLGFGVTIFCVGATITLAMLEVRRYCKCCGNGELGGPAATKWLTCVLFVLIWITYIALSGLNIYGLVG